MRWVKKGLIFATSHTAQWMQTHAQVPTVDWLTPHIIRIYFGTRDAENRTLTTHIDVQAGSPDRIVAVSTKPILQLGRPGCFDDCGVMPSWVVRRAGRVYLYYVGWNTAQTVPYRVSNGLAVSDDGGHTFHRLSEGPIMDRSTVDHYAVGTQSILIEGSRWRCWYMSYTGWETTGASPEPLYVIRYAESLDGVHWVATGRTCIDRKDPFEGGIARPCVLKTGDRYRMWYSTRGVRGYRDATDASYRIGYAESPDGLQWTRKDEEVDLPVSQTGWDSDMTAYPYVYEYGGRTYMLYNGNGFGQSGFGYAMLDRCLSMTSERRIE